MSGAPQHADTAMYERARRAVGLVFAVNGLAFASWASRTPGVKATLDLDASQLGLLLVCVSIGAMASMPLTGAIVHHIGPARAVLLGAGLEGSGYLVTAIGLSVSSVWMTGVGLLVAGSGISVWDVAMNVEGAAVERWLGRSIMARFHAGFSIGTVLGAGLGALAAAVGVEVWVQLLITAAVLTSMAVVGARAFTPVPEMDADDKVSSRSLLFKAWTTPRTIIVGLMVLAFAFSEGVANDWTAVAVVDGLGESEALGALGFGAFVVTMTVGRLSAGGAIDRWGRVVVLRAAVLVATVGVVLVIVGPNYAFVLAGSLLWGLGTALGFPTGMSAAADHTRHAAIHVSVVSAIGYVAFLAGPPVVGFLADELGVRHSLYVVVVALALAFVTAAAARPLVEEELAGVRSR